MDGYARISSPCSIGCWKERVERIFLTPFLCRTSTFTAARLFRHPARHDDEGKIISVVERTNNVAEHFFGADKQKLRRRLGRANLGRDLEDQPAQTTPASNLLHSDYVRVLCASLEHLPAAFAELERKTLRETSPLQRSNRDSRLLKRIGALMADEYPAQNNGISDRQIRQPDASVTEI